MFPSIQNRERQFHYSHFIRTHAGSREMFLYILKKYNWVKCRSFIADIDIDRSMKYNEIVESRNFLVSSAERQLLLQDEKVIEAIIKPFLNF